MEYKTHSREYLSRARKRLDEGSFESLFYAAFELRCGIESRLHQYENALVNTTKIKKAGWKVPKLADNLERVFNSGDKIARFDISDLATNKVKYSCYYTPVNKKLRDMVVKLGELLHYRNKYRNPKDKWWDMKRGFLESVYVELTKANLGSLLGVPLLNPNTHKVHIERELKEGEKLEDQLKLFGSVGEKVKISLRFYDEVIQD